METSDARAGSAQRRRSKAGSRSRAGVSEVLPDSLTNLLLGGADPVPLVNRLQLTWQPIPARREAKVYLPSSTQLSNVGENGTPGLTKARIKRPSRAVEPLKSPSSMARQRSRTRPADITAFEQKYAAEDPLMRYVLHVILTNSLVRRSEIPRGKHFQRKVRPEEDVLYLVHRESPPCGFRNVYWLTFADEGTICRSGHASSLEYFTLGSHGITRFKGEQGIEFLDLVSWVDEKRAFDSMTSMIGLKRIQQMVFFFSWKRQAVQRRLHRVQERLACSLFTCHPVAGRLLMDVRDVCAEIESEAEREYIDPGTSYTMSRLAHIHHDRACAANTVLVKKIRALFVAIDDATRDLSRYRDGEGCSYAITDHEAFSKSLRLSSLRERMFTFLRLVDCHLAEAVYQHVTIVVQDLRARICGQQLHEQPMAMATNGNGITEERSGYLCPFELSADTHRLSSSNQRVMFTVHAFESGASLVAFPGLYVSLDEDFDFEGDVNSAMMQFSPTKVEVFEFVHSILLKYCVAMDGLPRALIDTRFEHVLTPFVPLGRREFAESMLKPSHLVLKSYAPELLEMRAALDMHYRRIGILQQEHLRCVRAIKVAERGSPVEITKRNVSDELSESDEEEARLPELPDLSTSAAAYELAQTTWNRFVQYANTAAPMLQVGFLLLDQRSFVEKLRLHVSKRVAEMDNALPSIYQQFLTGLLQDVDGRIEKVTKIPTNLAEANVWLAQVTSMMPTHPFRQRLHLKCANLARLRVLIKECGLVSLDQEVQDSIRKLELRWESVIETLLLCLARVEERGSEHRRSVHDVITKVDEYVNGQLQLIVKTFEDLPSGCEEDGDSTSSSQVDASKKEEMVQQLEDLVALDLERKNVVQQFEEYDREHRAIMEMPALQQPVWTSTSSDNVSAISLTDKLPSELLLLYIVTSLELRQWFGSWKKMRDKWLGSPLTGVHPGTMINRIKQFRRRLGYASSRLGRLSSFLLQTLPLESSGQHQEHEEEDRRECPSFAKKDFELMKAFDDSIEEMLNCNRIFQAISGGDFSEARWAAMHHLLGAQSGSNGADGLTLRRMKEQCGAGQIEEFLRVCDECIVEAKFHVKLEQVRQRLARIEVRVEETNYSVRCEGVAEALAQLDDIAVDLKLCLFGQNPELQLCLELRDELERKVTVCEHIMAYQKHWRLRCEATKLHEVEEFFSKRSSGGDFAVPRARRPQHKSGLKQEQTVWQSFLDASYAWSDRLRRLFFVSPHQAQAEQNKTSRITSLGTKKPASAAASPMTAQRRLSTATKSVDCTLDDVMKSFEGFDFEANSAARERGMELVHVYLDSLREKSPRMYCLDEEMMLRLLLRDSDVRQLHQSLAVCFPRVHRFAISRAANRVGSSVEQYGKQESTPLNGPVRARKADGTIVIVGIEGVQVGVDVAEKSGRFRLPVAKIGRVKFWFTRLEEEMCSMVLSDLKRAFEWSTSGIDSSEFADYDALLPQSIVTASGFRFTYEMNRALRPLGHQTHQQLDQLQLTVNRRLDGLMATRRSDKSAASFVRLESMILLSVLHSEVVRHVIELSEQNQLEDALFFWSMQLQVRAFVETIAAPGSSAQPSLGKHGKMERNELLPTGPDSMEVTLPNQSGQQMNMSVYCQVAHLQLPLGQEFVGWGRLAILSPFTQRCSYALFNALRMHHTALVVPYNVHQAGKDPTSLLWSIGEMLMRPCIEFSCYSGAGITTTSHLGNLMSATTRLNGFLIVRHLLQLSPVLIGAVQQRMLQHFHQSATAGSSSLHHPQQQAAATSLVLHRQQGGLFYGASAIFTPLESTEDLQRSGWVQSIRTQFRAVAVTRPAVQYVAECLLMTDGFTRAQIRELNVVEAFKALATSEIEPIDSFDVELLVPRVIQEARRVREHFRVVWDSHPLTTGGNATKTLLQRRKSNADSGQMEICEGQCIFRHAFATAIKELSTKDVNLPVLVGRVNVLLVQLFPLSEGGRLVTKSKADEEAVAAAVSMYLESTLSLPANCEQFELIMELWRALQTFPAALVCGAPGSGKSSCITALHRALVALELSERSQENEEVGGRNSQAKPPLTLTQLVVLNPQLLALDQFYTSVAVACGAAEAESTSKQPTSSALTWVLLDGEIDGSMLDRLLEGGNRAVSSVSSLPSSSVLYRGLRCSVLSSDCSDPDRSPRLIFEVTNLASLSPSALSRCWTLHVPTHCITVASIIGTWRARWENQLVFSPESRGAEAMAVVFKTVDVLISSVCVRFAIEEATPDHFESKTMNSAGLSLGYLSLNHITQTALTMVSLCCYQNKTLLQELSYLRLVELVAFAVLWGFAGHLSDPFKIKLENYVRVKSKEFSETKHLAELPRGLLDANQFEDVWDELQPRLSASLTLEPSSESNSKKSKTEVKIQSAFDPRSGQVLVLIPAAASLVRVCTLLQHSSRSFLLIGPAASGKTSLLRWILHRNHETEVDAMKIEASLDERHVHGILDWMGIPAAWFRQLNSSDGVADSRAKLREEANLFAGRSKHSFVFLDDLDASGEIADKSQVEFVRTMLDHRLAYSTTHGGFQTVEKQVGAAVRLDEAGREQLNLMPALARLMRHFSVFRMPTYTHKDLLSVFRVKFQPHFKVNVSQTNTERRLSAKGGMVGGGGQQLPLEEVILRACVDFAVEISSLQQLGDTEHPCLCLFNLHHVNMLLERTLAFASDVSVSRKGDTNPASEGTTLVMLGKTHQSWLSELQNIFLSNCPTEAPDTRPHTTKTSEPTDDLQDKRVISRNVDDTQKKVSALLRHLSEKYFSVAFRASSDSNVPMSVEALHFLVKLAQHHVQAPLLQPRLIQLRELLNEHMTAANGVSRRSSDQVRGVSSASNWSSSPVELVSNVLLEIAAASSSADGGSGAEAGYCNKPSRPYSSSHLTAIEMKLLLSTSWCLTQATHLIHALSQQQQVIVSPSPHCSRLLSDRLLRFACDLHGFKVHTIDDDERVDQHKKALLLVLGAAGVRQERVALWVRQRQLFREDANCLVHILQELCLGKLPSLTLLPGGEELRGELVLSCIQSRKQLEVVTEAELLSEFQQRLQQNFRLCIIEDRADNKPVMEGKRRQQISHRSSTFVRWMKTRPSCHWRRIHFTEFELQRFIPEMAKAALASPALCGISWNVQQIAKYVVLCQNVHLQLMSASQMVVGPTSQMDYFLSFMTNMAVAYRGMLDCHQKEVTRLEIALETLEFARDKVVPTLQHKKQKFELESKRIESELEVIFQLIELEEVQTKASKGDKPVDEKPVDPELEEDRWALHSRYEELTMMNSETKVRLDEVVRCLAEWQHVAARRTELLTKWTLELNQERSLTEHNLVAASVCVGAQRTYTYTTALSVGKRKAYEQLLYGLIFESVNRENKAEIEKLINDSTDAFTVDESIGITRFIWTARFPFLRDTDVYRTVRLADDLCDRVPVLVDPSGVLQQFLVHVFSGHTLFSALPGCGGVGEVESEHPSVSKESMVISCDDIKLESQLQEAQRQAVPVLLVNFRSSDRTLLGRLQPFLGQSRLSHAPPRRPMLRELTVKHYEDQRKLKQRKTSIPGPPTNAMTSLAQPAATVCGSAALMNRRDVKAGKHKVVTVDPIAVAAAAAANSTMSNNVGKGSGRRDARARSAASSSSTSSSRCFQIYAVTARMAPLRVQHDLAPHFAHIAVPLPDSELKALLQLSRVGKGQHVLLQELRSEQISLADCWVKMIQNRDQLWQLLVRLKPAIAQDDSPFASQLANAVTIQLQERYSEFAAELGSEHQSELIWSSRAKSVQERYAELASASMVFVPTAIRLVGIARCMARMSSLSFGVRTSPFYLQSFRYLESAAAQQLATQGDEALQLSVGGVKALTTRICSGLVSESHRQIFCLLESLQQRVEISRSSTDEELQTATWKEAVVWLIASSVRRAALNDAGFSEAEDDKCHGFGISQGRRNSLRWPGDGSTSLVERLRRRVKLCSYLFNGWRPSLGSKSTRGKQLKAPRPVLDSPTAEKNQVPGMSTGSTGNSDSGSIESRDLAVEQLQRELDSLLSTSETLWYEWKSTRVRLQQDTERIIKALGYQDVSTWSSTERNSAIFPSSLSLVSLEDMATRFKLENSQSIPDAETESWQQALVRLLLAKTYFPSCFAQALAHYLRQDDWHVDVVSTRSGVDPPVDYEHWTTRPSPASLVADIAPSRGKNSRAHLPRALILYTPGERSNVELKLSAWDTAVFVDADPEHVALRGELTMLITTKHKFVLELLDAKQAESALMLVSELINEHALLSVPEWYLLASFAVATEIENGKLAVMDRIAVCSPDNHRQFDVVGRDRSHNTHTLEQVVKRKLVEEFGASDSVSSALTSAVLVNHGQNQRDRETKSSVVRDLEDLVLQLSSAKEVAVDNAEREHLTRRLLRLLAETRKLDGSVTLWNDATRAAVLSSELLSDLVSVGDSSLAHLADDPDEEWLQRCSSTGGEVACERLWASLGEVKALFGSLQVTSRVSSDPNVDASELTEFFPWRSFDIELTAQFSAFEAIRQRLKLLRVPPTTTTASFRESNRQQQLSSLARGFVPFEWTESFFTGTSWPSQLSGSLSTAQLLLLVACRVGVLVHCLRGDRAWALNLAVVSDVCGFLRDLRTFTSARSSVSESSLVLVLELDSSTDVTDISTATNEEEEKKKKKALEIAKQLGAICGRESDWHGAVLNQTEGGMESWGIRVEGLVLIQQTSTTKLHPLPMCRIVCHPCAETTSMVEAPIVLLPSLSPYQPAPTNPHDVAAIRVVLGRSINSVVDVNLSTNEMMQYAVGVPVLPDDDGSDSS